MKKKNRRPKSIIFLMVFHIHSCLWSLVGKKSRAGKMYSQGFNLLKVSWKFTMPGLKLSVGFLPIRFKRVVSDLEKNSILALAEFFKNTSLSLLKMMGFW